MNFTKKSREPDGVNAEAADAAKKATKEEVGPALDDFAAKLSNLTKLCKEKVNERRATAWITAST